MSEMDMNLSDDTIARNRIVSEMKTNFFVEAGAGSGKTTMLVNRMVAMVESGIDISKICAITFTKAAAGEFYERFQNTLTERSNQDIKWKDTGRAGQLGKPTSETIRRCAEALKNIDLCFMGTIDSFCNMILSEHPAEACIPSDSSVISDVESEAIYKQLYVRICDGKYGSELVEKSRRFRLFYGNPEEIFIQGISVLMNNRNVNFQTSEYIFTDFENWFKNDKISIIRAFGCLEKHAAELMYDEVVDSVWGNLSRNLNAVKRNWNINMASVIKALESFSKIRVKKEALINYPTELEGVFPQVSNRTKILKPNLEDTINSLNKFKYSASVEFLMDCVVVLEKEMREKGKLSYFDYLYYLRNMLKKDAEESGTLIKYIFDRHQFFLIDEFQDTNPMQAEVFFYLSAENPVSEWRKCNPKSGSLFIVGDPKQSIYRFRSADVTSFLNVRTLFENGVGEVLKLSRNFRSCSKLIKYFNETFRVMLGEESRYQSKFSEIPVPDEPVKNDILEGVYKYIAAPTNKGEIDINHTDPYMIGKIIVSLTENEKCLIQTSSDSEPRRIQYNDIMIITSSKGKLHDIMARLDTLRIPVKVEGSVPFEENEALVSIGDIFKVVSGVYDKINICSALTSKIFGFTHEDLINFRNANGKLSMNIIQDSACSEDERISEIYDVFAKLNKLQKKALKMSPAAVFEMIMDEFRIFEKVSTDNLEVLYYSLELLRSAESSGTVASLSDGSGFIDNLLSGNSGQERCLSLDADSNCVHMANIHKVKGLEAPVVILASSGQKTNFHSDIRVEHNEDGTKGYIFSLSKRISDSQTMTFFKTNEFTAADDEEKLAYKEEDKRLVYVAATRAANVLIIGESARSKWSSLLTGSNDISYCLPELLDNREFISESIVASKLYSEAEKTSVLSSRTIEEETYFSKYPSKLDLNELPVNKSDDSLEEKEKQSIRPVHWFPDDLGKMVHKLLEIMVSSRNYVNTSDLVTEILNEYINDLTKPYEFEFRKALYCVSNTIQQGGYPQSNGASQNILSELLSAEECYTEIPFCYKDKSGDKPIVWNGIIDVAYKKNGIWHIIDYKTNLDGSSLDAVYEEQLNAYVKAFETITGEKVGNAYTYHISV